MFANENIGTGRIVNITSSYSGDDIGNYNITDQSTHFANITIGNPTISGLSNQTKNFTTSSYTLPGTSSISGLPIVYSSSDTSVATVDSGTGKVTFVNVGTVTISANIVSTLNYNSATSSYILEINLNATNINNITSNVINSSGTTVVNQSATLNNANSFSKSLRLAPKQDSGTINAKIVVIKDNFDANVEGIYTEAISGGEISNEFNDEEEKEKFEEPGKIIDERTIILKISENNSYNYQLELRQKGLVIKPLDNSSVSFVESNKGLVIESAISEVINIVGFVKSQLKTIVIDIKNRF